MYTTLCCMRESGRNVVLKKTQTYYNANESRLIKERNTIYSASEKKQVRNSTINLSFVSCAYSDCELYLVDHLF